jgi:putative transposase
MSRPLRVLVAGGLYHVTSRGNHREAIYHDDRDRRQWLSALARVCGRFAWRVHAWCQMNNHYHLVVETADESLSRGVGFLNGLYAQRFNFVHGNTGHLFQGRFHAALVERQSHLLELVRYVVLNPVRAAMVRDAAHWPWSNYRSTIGSAAVPPWLDADWTLTQFDGNRCEAIARYKDFVRAGVGRPSIWTNKASRLVLGGADFAERIRGLAVQAVRAADSTEIPRAYRQPPGLPLSHYASTYPDQREGMAQAYAAGGYSMKAIGVHFGVHRSTVARAVVYLESARRVGDS